MPDCYYLAEVESAPTFEQVVKNAGNMEVEFIAYPFKYGIALEGSDQPWDLFNFNIGCMQESKFNITGNRTIEIYNVGRDVCPVVSCTSSMTMKLNGYTANFNSGESTDWRFKLKTGANTITINGTGDVEFKFRKELL
ncbi:hypothetical protein SDC9_210831 [bioreactor metagenome]|uniref:Phage tail protein n=1 Tax=bioreactor metagenome TaxID=1076179 RepID=A0A645JIB1_9ZZZZ